LGIFIDIEIDEAAFADDRTRRVVVDACPVDIFALRDERLVSRPEREDECLLCGLCLAAAPLAAVTVRRRYGAQRALTAAPERHS